MRWDYNSHIVCMCITMRWSQNRSTTWAERFRTSSLLCTYKLCDYYSPIPILSPFLFTPSLYVPILNLQDFSFTCINVAHYDMALPHSQQIPVQCYIKSLTLTHGLLRHVCPLAEYGMGACWLHCRSPTHKMTSTSSVSSIAAMPLTFTM